MTYNLNGKNITISDDYITKAMKALEITKDEAVQMYLEDEGYLDNEEQTALDEKAKKAKVVPSAKSEKKTERKPRERKADDFKDAFVEHLRDWLEAEGYADTKIAIVGKKVDFTADGVAYTLDLVRHRPKK